MSDEIDALIDRASTANKDDALLEDIKSMMARLLEGKRETLTYWDKSCFASALHGLRPYIGSGLTPNKAWLAPSLAALKMLFVPEDKRSDQIVAKESIDTLTFEQIMGDIRRLGEHRGV